MEAAMIRREHPGCGVEKMYILIRPNWIGRDRFIDLMMESAYRVQRPKNYHRTTYSISANYYPNYIEGLEVGSVNLVWQTDITYFKIGDRHYYLTFIIDVYSKRIVGYNASDNMQAESNIQTLQQAFRLRRGADLSKLIHHSDRGGQYIDKVYVGMLKDKKIQISMGLKAQDNAYAERINGTIKNEYLKAWEINSFAQLKRKLKKAVENYNGIRPHDHLPNRMTPIDFEKMLSLGNQKRPRVIIYAEGNPKIKEASSLLYFKPEEEPQAHICPIVN